MERNRTSFWRVMVLAAAVIGAVGASAAYTEDDNDDNPRSARPLTIGVIGDMPYPAQQVATFQGFLNAMSSDPKFQLTIHLGDMKSGSSACTDAYIKGIRDALNSYSGALVYTPGDNEWTDCHRNASDPKNPVGQLNFLRAKFFFNPGTTLGIRPRRVLTQSSEADFAAFVENQAWVDAKTVLAVINLPGSNNDLDPWTNGVGTPLTRIVVQGGSAHFPLEYLRVTIDPHQKTSPFSWERVTPTLAP